MTTTEILQQYTITREEEGQRLDVALASFMPERSLREVRCLWQQFLIELNGRHSRKGMPVKEGDVITVASMPAEPGLHIAATPSDSGESALLSCVAYPEPDISMVRVLKRESGVLAIFKPAGLHSANLPGGMGGLSLETLLPELCAQEKIAATDVRLFNRLDCLTTGMVLACENDEAMHSCEQAELSGEMEKRYFALVQGQLHSELVIKNALDTDSRIKTKVLAKESPDSLRHTTLTPLHSVSNGAELGSEFAACTCGLTLVQAVIYRGARHQIRAHLAQAGYPIWGDPLYNSACPNSKVLYLHNFAVAMPGFMCLARPVWPQQALQILKGLFPGLFQV